MHLYSVQWSVVILFEFFILIKLKQYNGYHVWSVRVFLIWNRPAVVLYLPVLQEKRFQLRGLEEAAFLLLCLSEVVCIFCEKLEHLS